MSIILIMSHDMEPQHGQTSHGLLPIVGQAGVAVRDSAQSLFIGMDIAARLRQAGPTLGDTIVRRVAGLAAREVIILRQPDSAERTARIEGLRQRHIDDVGSVRQRSFFEGDEDVTDDGQVVPGAHHTEHLLAAEWSAITQLAKGYDQRGSDRRYVDAALPFLRLASQIQVDHPGN